MKFPERVYTAEEVKTAKELIEKGHRHRLRVKGSPEFRRKVKEALRLTKTAKYYDFLRTYIKQIVEIDGFSQLRESEAAVWLNNYAVADSVEAASYVIQKVQQMKDYIEGRLYYDKGEINAVEKRIEFLETLKNKTKNQAVKKRCREILKKWVESKYF